MLVTEELKEIKKYNEKILQVFMEGLGESKKTRSKLPKETLPSLNKLGVKVCNENNVVLEEENFKIKSEKCLTSTDASPSRSEEVLMEDISQPSSPLLLLMHKKRKENTPSLSCSFVKCIHNFFVRSLISQRIKK